MKKAKRRFLQAIAEAGSTLLSTPERFKYVEAELGKAGNEVQAALHANATGGGGRQDLRDLQHHDQVVSRQERQQARDVRQAQREAAAAARSGARNESAAARAQRAQERAAAAAARAHARATGRSVRGRTSTGRKAGGKGKGKAKAPPAFFAHESQQTVHDLSTGHYGPSASSTAGSGGGGGEARVPSGGPGGGEWTKT